MSWFKGVSQSYFTGCGVSDLFRLWRYPVVLMLLFLLSGCSGTTSFFFYPQSRWASTPADVGQPYKNMLLTAADGTRLHAWWLPARSGDGLPEEQPSVDIPDTVVLYLHGNAQNVSTHSHSIYWLTQQGVDVLALDYRGFGASQGEAQLPDIMQDLEVGVRWIRQQYPEKRLIILGQSIGASLAVSFTAQAQSRYAIDGLILDAPFEGFAKAARHVTGQNVIGWLIWPFTVLVPDDWDPVRWAHKVQVPVLVMHSPDDEVIPYTQGRAVFKRLQQAPGAEACWLESKGRHIASFSYPQLREATLNFIRSGGCP